MPEWGAADPHQYWAAAEVHLGPAAVWRPDEKDSLPGITAKSAAIQEHNAALRFERTRVDEDLEKEKKLLEWLEARIWELAQELQRAAERLAEMVQERFQERDRGWSR